MGTDNCNKFNMNPIPLRGVGCKRSIRLKNASDIMRLMGRTINEVMRGEIETDTARTVGYLSSVMIKALEISDIQKRLDALEKATENARKEWQR